MNNVRRHRKKDEWGIPPQQLSLIEVAHMIRSGIQLYQLAKKIEALPNNWETEGEALLKEMKYLFADGLGKWYDGEGQYWYERVENYLNWQRSQPRQLTLFK